MSGLNLASPRKGTYTASLAFTGDYEITVRRLWGMPANGKFRLHIIYHQGTPQEKHQIETITIGQTHTMKLVLANGRRTELAQIATISARPESKDQEIKSNNIMGKLRVHSKLEAVAFGLRHRLVEPPRTDETLY